MPDVMADRVNSPFLVYTKILTISGHTTGKRARLGDVPTSVIYYLLEIGRLIGPHFGTVMS